MRTLVVILVLLPQVTWGQQNLVPNASFEDKSECPENPPQLYLCYHWMNPNAASPDYYHECSPPLMNIFGPDTVYTPNAGIPANAFGYQPAHSGEAYAGIYCLAVMQPDAGEYIQVQLTDSIVPSIRYLVSFYASLADNGRYAINPLGAYLSKESITSDNVQIFEVEPQILNTIDNPLTNPDVWVLITDTFSSRYGGERYLTIGNFNTTETSDTVLYNPDGDISAIYAYYYIDDVSVIAIDSISNGLVEEEYTETAFRAYPNPNSGHLTLSYALQQDETGTLRIFTTVGTLIHQQQLMPTATVIDVDLSGLGNGMYLLSIDVDGEQRFAERVAIMKE